MPCGKTGTFNTPALVRCQPLYILLRVEQRPVFLVNSRQGYFRCAPLCSLRSSAGSPYRELTDTFLPSSFRSFHPFTLVYYHTNPPVSVCGTDPHSLTLRVFLGNSFVQVARTVVLTSPLRERKSNNPIKTTNCVTLRKSAGGWNISQLSIIRRHSALD